MSQALILRGFTASYQIWGRHKNWSDALTMLRMVIWLHATEVHCTVHTRVWHKRHENWNLIVGSVSYKFFSPKSCINSILRLKKGQSHEWKKSHKKLVSAVQIVVLGTIVHTFFGILEEVTYLPTLFGPIYHKIKILHVF